MDRRDANDSGRCMMVVGGSKLLESGDKNPSLRR